MNRQIKWILLVVLTTTSPLFGQKISNIDFDNIKSQTQDSTSIYYYPVLIQRFMQFDTTLTGKEFSMIYYGNVFTDKYNPYGSGKNVDKFMKLYMGKKFKEAIPYGEKALADNPVNLKILFKVLVCFHSLGDKSIAKKYAKLYYGLLNEIYKSGDGKNFESAYVVTNVADEYEILADLELTSIGQALIDDTDVLTLDTTGQENSDKKIEKLYFNVSQSLNYLSREFKQKD